VEPVSMADCRVEMRRISMLYRWTEFNLTTNLPVQTGVDFLLKKKPVWFKEIRCTLYQVYKNMGKWVPLCCTVGINAFENY